MNGLKSNMKLSEEDRPPFISVIIASYNSALTLERALESFYNQEYPYKELILIDGGSVDGSVDILNRYDDYIEYWVSEKDKGVYHAWNKALRRANGDWIYFLGADDYFYDSKVLSSVALHLKKANHNGIRIVYGKVHVVDKTGKLLFIANGPWQETRKKFNQIMAIHHQGVFHHISIFKEYGPFDESFKIAGDYELLLRVLKSEDPYFMDDIIVAVMQVGGISSKEGVIRDILKENLRGRRKNGLRGITPFFIGFYLYTFIRPILYAILGDKLFKKLIILLGRCIGYRSNWDCDCK